MSSLKRKEVILSYGNQTSDKRTNVHNSVYIHFIDELYPNLNFIKYGRMAFTLS